jgi:hypothetical protein
MLWTLPATNPANIRAGAGRRYLRAIMTFSAHAYSRHWFGTTNNRASRAGATPTSPLTASSAGMGAVAPMRAAS